MSSDKLDQLWGLLNPSRFPRTPDKILNFLIIGTALPLALIWSLAKDVSLTSKFTDLYRELMPRDMLIRYRGCLFVARQGHPDIIWLSKAYEPYAFQQFNPTEGEIVVDIGAHIGKYTLPSAKSVGDKGHIFAFEAVPGHYQALEKNIKRNGLSNITSINAATYDENQDMWLVGWDLKTDPDPDHPEKEHVNPEGSMPVEAVTVDSVLEEHDIESVDYVKIDIGRQELNALKGMQSILSASDEMKILVEVERDNYEDVDDLLTGFGFSGTALEEDWGGENQIDFLYEK